MIKVGDGVKFLNYGLPVTGIVRAVNRHPGRGALRPDTVTVFCDDLDRTIELPVTTRFEVIPIALLPEPLTPRVVADMHWLDAQRKAESANVRYLANR